ALRLLRAAGLLPLSGHRDACPRTILSNGKNRFFCKPLPCRFIALLGPLLLPGESGGSALPCGAERRLPGQAIHIWGRSLGRKPRDSFPPCGDRRSVVYISGQDLRDPFGLFIAILLRSCRP